MLSVEIRPLISIVTVCYNAVATIEETVKSVLEQSYTNIEYIIIDGGSNDGTVKLIEKQIDKIAYWVSEPDKGIYDAMNKGIDKASGLFTIFVNSGDYLYQKDTLEQLINSVDNLSDYDMVYGRSKIIKADGHVTDLVVKHGIQDMWKGPSFRHGALFAKTELLKQNKFEISEALKIAADFDFIYKMKHKGYTFKGVDVVILAFLEDGVSNDLYKHLVDCTYILKKYGDWNAKTQLYYKYRYGRLVLSQSKFRYIYKIFHLFFHNYLSNHLINKIPFYFIRHLYYKKVMGLKMGKGSSIHLNCFVFGNNIQIAERSTINRRCFLDGRGRIYIGNNVSVSPEVHLITEDHNYNSANFAGRSRDIVIDDYVWIGVRAIILPGVHIGKGAVVCAGAVVTKNIGEYEVVAGVPAVKIKERNRDLNYNPSWLPFFD
jgi:acetyltransferase-like isoleucine patch superfamily enzyme